VAASREAAAARTLAEAAARALEAVDAEAPTGVRVLIRMAGPAEVAEMAARAAEVAARAAEVAARAEVAA
jgi:hypothetical protein